MNEQQQQQKQQRSNSSSSSSSSSINATGSRRRKKKGSSSPSSSPNGNNDNSNNNRGNRKTCGGALGNGKSKQKSPRVDKEEGRADDQQQQQRNTRRKQQQHVMREQGQEEEASAEEVEGNAMLEDCLDELVLKFILNCPAEEYESFDRLFFQFEEAYWYYEDFLKGKQSPKKHKQQQVGGKQPALPHLTFMQFADRIFSRVPSLEQHREAVSAYTQSFFSYKHSVPVYGAIMVNARCSKVLLVQSYNSKSGSWGFPRGKINKGENEVECAVREVREEVGYDLEGSIREDWFVEPQSGTRRRMKLFVVFNVKEKTQFRTQTRKEIGKIQWHSIQRILQSKNGSASGYFLVRPFVRQMVQQQFYKDATANRAALESSPPRYDSQIQDIPEFSGTDAGQGNIMDMLNAAVTAATVTTPRSSRKEVKSIQTTPSYNKRKHRHKAKLFDSSDSGSDSDRDCVSPVSAAPGMRIMSRPVSTSHVSHSLGHSMRGSSKNRNSNMQFGSPNKRTREVGTRQTTHSASTIPISHSFSEGSFMSFAFDVDDILQEE